MLLNLIFLLTFILFSFGQLGRISFYGQQINIYLYEFFLFIVLLLLFLRYRLKPLYVSFVNYKAVFVFFLFILFSFIVKVGDFKPYENLVGFMYIVRLAVYFLYFFYLSKLVEDNQNHKLFRLCIKVLFFLTILTSMIQFFLYPNLRNLQYAGWDPHIFRMFGLFFDTSISGAVYGLFFLHFLFSETRSRHEKAARIIFLITLSFLILLTFSRSLYIASFIALAFYFGRTRSWKKITLVLLLFLALIFVPSKTFNDVIGMKRLFTISARADNYRTAVEIAKDNLLVGVGYNRIRYVKKQLDLITNDDVAVSHSGASFHSSFLVILVAGGLAGLLLYLFVLKELALKTEKAGYYILFLGLLSLSDNVLLHPFICFLLFSFLAADGVSRLSGK